MKSGYVTRIIIVLGILKLSLFAQDFDNSPPSEDTTLSLDNIVVTATRSKRLVSESPSSVSVITKKEIASSPAKTVEDLIITQPGIQATRSVAIGEGIPSSIVIRGIPGSLAASRTLILVDGIPTNASGTPFTIVNEIPMEAIERIEIVRGPHSSLYGANAVGGAINILTKEGYGKPNGGITGETSYPFSVADYIAKDTAVSRAFQKSGKMAYWNGNATLNGGNDKAGYLVSGGYKTIGNYLLCDSAQRRKGALTYFTKADNYDYAEYRLFGKGRWYLSDNCELSLHSRYFNSNLGFGKTKDILPDSLDDDIRGNKFLIGPRMKLTLSPVLQIKAGAFYRQVIGKFINEGRDSTLTWVPTIWESNTKDWQVESQVSFTPGHGHAITAGLEYLDNNANFGAMVDRNTGAILPNSFSTKKGIVNLATFVQDELTLFDRLTVVPAMRVDYHSDFGATLSPKLGLNCRAAKILTLRASSGKSFRAPSLSELYMPNLTINPDVMVIANPDLKPEYIWGTDAGFDCTPLRSVTVKADIYYNTMQDLISQMIHTINIDTTSSITHRNITEAWSQGIEGEVSWRALSWLRLMVNGTLQQSKDKTYDVPLDYMPGYTANFRVFCSYPFHHRRIEGEFGINHVGDRKYLDFATAKPNWTPDGIRLEIPLVILYAHTSVDFAGKIALTSRFTLSLTIQNLLNAQWEEAAGTLMPQRFASIKGMVTF